MGDGVMVLADGIAELELLKSLSQNWPMLAALLGSLWWFATKIAKPLTERHIAWMDAMESRDQQRLASDIEHKNTLNTVHEKVVALNDKASTIKDIVSRGLPPIQPRGG